MSRSKFFLRTPQTLLSQKPNGCGLQEIPVAEKNEETKYLNVGGCPDLHPTLRGFHLVQLFLLLVVTPRAV